MQGCLISCVIANLILILIVLVVYVAYAGGYLNKILPEKLRHAVPEKKEGLYGHLSKENEAEIVVGENGGYFNRATHV